MAEEMTSSQDNQEPQENQELQGQVMQADKLGVFFEQIESALASAPTEVRRLFHGRGKCFPGLEQLTCDWAANQLLVNLFKPVDEIFLTTLKQGLMELVASTIWEKAQGKAVVLQHRYSDARRQKYFGVSSIANLWLKSWVVSINSILVATKISVCFSICETAASG